MNLKTLATNRGEEVVDNLVLLNRHAVKEDFLREKTGCETALRRLKKTPSADLERADAALLYEAAELGHRNPLILVVAAAPVIDR